MVGGDVGVQSGADLSGEIGGIMKSLCRAMSCRICPFLSGIRYCQYHQYHQLLTISSVTSILYIYINIQLRLPEPKIVVGKCPKFPMRKAASRIENVHIRKTTAIEMGSIMKSIVPY